MEALKYMYEPGEHATVKILPLKNLILPLKILQNFLRSRENGTKNLI